MRVDTCRLEGIGKFVIGGLSRPARVLTVVSVLTSIVMGAMLMRTEHRFQPGHVYGQVSPPENTSLSSAESALNVVFREAFASGKTLVAYVGECSSCAARNYETLAGSARPGRQLVLLTAKEQAAQLDATNRHVARVTAPMKQIYTHFRPAWPGQWWLYENGRLTAFQTTPTEGASW